MTLKTTMTGETRNINRIIKDDSTVPAAQTNYIIVPDNTLVSDSLIVSDIDIGHYTIRDDNTVDVPITVAIMCANKFDNSIIPLVGTLVSLENDLATNIITLCIRVITPDATEFLKNVSKLNIGDIEFTYGEDTIATFEKQFTLLKYALKNHDKLSHMCDIVVVLK